jgi:hypothetical protein
MSNVIRFPGREMFGRSVCIVAQPLAHFRYTVMDDEGYVAAQTCCLDDAIASAKCLNEKVIVVGPPKAFQKEPA